MEQSFLIPTKDNHVIQGKLNSAAKSNSLIIFAHGLGGSLREHQYFNAVPFFTSHGFDVCRFNFYSDVSGSRSLSECTLSIHASDLETVIRYYQDSYNNIYLVGHSLAAPVITRTNLEFIRRIILWDPTKSLTPSKQQQLRFSKELDMYIKPGKMETLLNKVMVDEWVAASDLGLEIQKLIKPTKFIFAGRHNNQEAWVPVIPTNAVQFEVVTIEYASHSFDEEGAELQLFEETLKFIKDETVR